MLFDIIERLGPRELTEALDILDVRFCMDEPPPPSSLQKLKGLAGGKKDKYLRVDAPHIQMIDAAFLRVTELAGGKEPDRVIVERKAVRTVADKIGAFYDLKMTTEDIGRSILDKHSQDQLSLLLPIVKAAAGMAGADKQITEAERALLQTIIEETLLAPQEKTILLAETDKAFDKKSFQVSLRPVNIKDLRGTILGVAAAVESPEDSDAPDEEQFKEEKFFGFLALELNAKPEKAKAVREVVRSRIAKVQEEIIRSFADAAVEARTPAELAAVSRPHIEAPAAVILSILGSSGFSVSPAISSVLDALSTQLNDESRLSDYTKTASEFGLLLAQAVWAGLALAVVGKAMGGGFLIGPDVAKLLRLILYCALEREKL